MPKYRFLSWRWWLGIKPKEVNRPPDRKYSISVLIPAYNEQASIVETIKSIKCQSIPINEIIVIDDHSTDRTGATASILGATVVRTDKNQGTKARAQQYVIEKGYIKTDLFVTIDGDTILDPYAIERTLPYFNDPLTASVCGFVIPAKIETVWEKGRFIEYVFGISIFKAAQNNIGAVLVSSGCFSIFRTELVNRMGGFEARTMAEDMDLTWSFALKGYHVYCNQSSFCYPYDPPTCKIFVDQIDRWYRSFFQNIAIHRKNFGQNKKLALFIYGYLIESIISPVLMFIVFLLFVDDMLAALLLAILLDLSLVSFFCLIEGVRLHMFWKMLVSIPSYFVIRPINLVIFWRSLWKEWIKKEPLTTWNKGH